jgi:hypothetical protein
LKVRDLYQGDKEIGSVGMSIFDKYGDDGWIILYCHSQGAIQTRNALASYDPERRKRICVIAVAPAAYINEDLCGQVVHLISKSDPIPWIDFMGRMRNKDTIWVLDRHPDAPYFDHSFKSPTYKQEIKEWTDYFREKIREKRRK